MSKYLNKKGQIEWVESILKHVERNYKDSMEDEIYSDFIKNMKKTIENIKG